MSKEKNFALHLLSQVSSGFVINNKISVSYFLGPTHGFKNLSPCLSLQVPLLITEISKCFWYLLLEKYPSDHPCYFP